MSADIVDRLLGTVLQLENSGVPDYYANGKDAIEEIKRLRGVERRLRIDVAFWQEEAEKAKSKSDQRLREALRTWLDDEPEEDDE